MKTAIRKSKARGKTADWLLGNVPAAEIESCFYYEYACINRPITDCIMRWRKEIGRNLEKAYKAALTGNDIDPRGTAFNDALCELTPLVGKYYFVEAAAFLLRSRCFPDKPWRELRKADKAAWENALNLYRHFEKRKGGLSHIELFRSNLEDFYQAQFGPTPKGASVTYAAFECDWRGGVEKVIADFERWARKQWNKLKHKKRPRHLHCEWLKQLSVVWLHQKLKDWGEVQATLRKHGICYGDPNRDSDTRACQRAAWDALKRKVFPIV